MSRHFRAQDWDEIVRESEALYSDLEILRKTRDQLDAQAEELISELDDILWEAASRDDPPESWLEWAARVHENIMKIGFPF